MRTLTIVLTISIILISLAIGVADYNAFGGSTSILNPAAAIATVIAFVSLVLYDEEGSGKVHRAVLESSLMAAVLLDALKIISLAFDILMPPKFKMELLWFGLGFVELKKIWLFATQPFTIGPKAYTAKALALDPVPFILLGYYFMVVKRKKKS